MASEPWSLLKPGDGFVVRSHSGNAYVLTFLGSGQRHAGLYVRFGESGKLARFYVDMLDWATFEPGDAEPILTRRSEVLASVAGPVEHRGEVLEIDDSRLVLRLRDTGISVPIPRSEIVHLKLLFWASDWRAGDAFLIESRSGKEYRGVTLNVLADKVEVTLLPRAGVSDGQRVALRIGQLSMKSFRVLISIDVECVKGPSTQAPARV